MTKEKDLQQRTFRRGNLRRCSRFRHRLCFLTGRLERPRQTPVTVSPLLQLLQQNAFVHSVPLGDVLDEERSLELIPDFRDRFDYGPYSLRLSLGSGEQAHTDVLRG